MNIKCNVIIVRTSLRDTPKTLHLSPPSFSNFLKYFDMSLRSQNCSMAALEANLRSWSLR